jgi:predicted dehydrogenase
VYDSWQRLLTAEAGRLDAVAILTPPADHVDIICALLKEKVPIICEKPLASSVEGARRIREAFHESENFLAVTFNYSGYPMVRELRERVRDGELGQLRQIQFEMPQEGFVRIDAISRKLIPSQIWRLEDGFIPTICLDLGVHLHHLAYFLTGKEATRTIGEFSNHSAHHRLVDDVMMWLEYEDGMKGSFWMSKVALGNRNGLKLRLYGTKGSAEWVQTDPEHMSICYHDGARTIVDRAAKTKLCAEPRYNRYRAGHPSGFIEAFANLYYDIAESLMVFRANGKHENPYVFGIGHSMNGLELLTAARKSGEDRHWIDTNLPLKK